MDEGTIAFTVDVPSEGDYSVNVAYNTATTRTAAVSVNGGAVNDFTFASSGKWCYQGGKSTVLPIELQGFIAGTNIITFGTGTLNEKHPMIEWISVVVDDDV
jgi:hypothetical protein